MCGECNLQKLSLQKKWILKCSQQLLMQRERGYLHKGL